MQNFLRQILILICCIITEAIVLSGSSPGDTIQLENVQVKGFSLSAFSTGNKIESMKQEAMLSHSHTNLGQLLFSTSLINTNTYGPLTNISMRGSGASHTAILWNGFNIQNTLNGGVNLAELPVCFMDDVKIQYGGCSALFGSGAIGGIVHLNNRMDYNKGFSAEISANAGSFGMQRISGNLGYSNRRYAGSIRFTEHSIANNYTFKNTAEYRSPLDTMKNAANRGKGIILDNQFKINNRQQIISHIWIQENKSEIPSPIIQSPDYGKQISSESRATLEWQYNGDRSDSYIRTAYFNEHLQYHSLLDSGNHRAITYITEAEQRYKISHRQTLRYGTNYTREEGGSDYFANNHIRNRNAFYGSYKILSASHNSSYSINIREEFINGVATPLTFSTGINCYISKNITLKSNLSKNYRIPDFNDLYWNVWGNPNLKPESGYSSDAGYIYTKNIQSVKLTWDQTAYAGIISNWIIWQPSGSLWHPYNVDMVFSRGLENNFKVSYEKNDFKIETGLGYTLTYATKLKAENNDPSLTGKQLIYVPKNKVGGSVSIRYKTASIQYYHMYTGPRYYDAGNTLSVNGFSIGNLILANDFNIKKTAIRLNLYINNVWNEDYQVMKWYPMPGRNYMAGLTFRFN